MQDWFIEWAGRGYANATPRIVRADTEQDAVRVLVAAFGWTNIRMYRGKGTHRRYRLYVDHCSTWHEVLAGGRRDPHPDWLKRRSNGRPIRCERDTLEVLPLYEVDDWAKKRAVRESRKALHTA